MVSRKMKCRFCDFTGHEFEIIRHLRKSHEDQSKVYWKGHYAMIRRAKFDPKVKGRAEVSKPSKLCIGLSMMDDTEE